MARTVFNPSKFLSPETRSAIKALGISLDNYVSNIESRLRALGEHGLADRMISEIEEQKSFSQFCREVFSHVAIGEKS